MSGVCPRFAALLAVALAAGPLTSCRDRKETVGADLAEAGFQMTEEDWFRACREGNVEAMKKFLSASFSKDVKDASGDGSLHVAAAAGSQTSADFLLKRGLAIEGRGAKNRTPLMSAVVAGRPEMVAWLLRQGADPLAKDDESFTPLMLAVKEGKAASVEQLAAYDREDLDKALLLAALLGRKEVIDSLTNYGASVYSRMDDGRTPLMIAAENGHADAVKLLLEIGSSRYTTDSEGKTAAMLAEEAGHAEIAALISQKPVPDEFAIATEAEVAAEMDAAVNAAAGGERKVSAPIDGAVLGQVASGGGSAGAPAAGGDVAGGPSAAPVAPAGGDAPAVNPRRSDPPVVMRYYREKDVPLQVVGVQGGTAVVNVPGSGQSEFSVKEGDAIPGSKRLYVVKVRSRMEDSKVGDGRTMEVAVIEVADRETGRTREWISGRESMAHDPVALVEDPSTGARYTARPGQRFRTADGGEFLISDVRPNQIVIEDTATGEVRTVHLIGPRG